LMLEQSTLILITILFESELLINWWISSSFKAKTKLQMDSPRL
jgi:hypothetical protein